MAKKTYHLTITIQGDDLDEKLSMPLPWEKDDGPYLSDLRKELTGHPSFLGKLPEPDSDFRFQDGGVLIDAEADESAYELDRWKATSGGEKGRESYPVTVVVLSDPVPAVPVPDPASAAASKDAIYVDVTIGNDAPQRQSFDQSAATLTLEELRRKLAASATIDLPARAQFLTADGVRIDIKEEKGLNVAALDPAPTVSGDRGVYKVKAGLPKGSPADISKLGSRPIKPPPVQTGESTTVEPPDLTARTAPSGLGRLGETATEYWTGLGNEKKRCVAVDQAQMFCGFNLPIVKEEKSLGDSDDYPPVLELSNQRLFEQPAEKIDGVQRNDMDSIETGGYSRLEVQLKRSFSIAVAAEFNYANTFAAEAEYGHAKASRVERGEERFFLTSDIFHVKVELTLPLTKSGQIVQDSQALVSQEFAVQVGKLQTPEDLFNLLNNWGALIARKIMVGGVVYLEEEKKDLQSFDATSEINTFSAKVKGSYGSGSGAVSTQGSVSEDRQRQLNEVLRKARVKAKGGRTEYAENKDIPQWIASLGPSSTWAPIRREQFLPVYVLLDDELQAHFLDLLVKAGRAVWESQTTVRSLRFVDYDWYVGYAEGKALKALFG